MNHTPTREQLELAALACGKEGELKFFITKNHRTWGIRLSSGKIWQPHLPTTQGKADLLDLIDKAELDVLWVRDKKEVVVGARHPVIGYIAKYKDDGNKNAALAQAAITVAALVGAKMKGDV